MSQRIFGPESIDINRLPLEEGVLIGKSDDLYLMGGMHWILKFAIGEASLAEATVETFYANIELRRRVAERYACRYMHIIAPEKYVVVPQNMPFEARDHMASALLRRGLPDDIVYPRELMSSLPEGQAYYRTDSHWAVAGRVAIAGLIAARSGLPTAVIEAGGAALHAALKASPVQDFCGDLGRKLKPPRHETTPVFRRPHPVVMSENGLQHVAGTLYNDGRIIVAKSEYPTAADASLMIFGDSYLHLTLDYLAAYFKTITFCRSRFIHDEMVNLVRPDMIVTQNAERYLNTVESDRTAPAFLLIPYLLGRKPLFEVPATEAIASVLRSNKAF